MPNKQLTTRLIWLGCALLAILVGIYSGIFWRNYKNSKTVVFRISTQTDFLDYDLLSAIKYLQYKFEKKGYTVLPWRYPGAFYHQEGDNAGINIFIRSSEFFYDTRMNKNAVNIYFLHRFFHIYAEEMQNYDYYLSSQKSLKRAFNNRLNIGYFATGAIPHKRLEPHYEYDILYISEIHNIPYMQYLNDNHKFKYYSSLDFGQLTEEERKQALAKARFVVYEMEETSSDDADYTPYAVYDIISYGRPIITKYKRKLHKDIKNKIYYYHNLEDMIPQTMRVLREKDDIREAKAQEAREKVISDSKNVKLEFLPLKK